MSTEENKAIVRRVIEEFNQGNVAAMSESWTPDLVYHDPNNPQVRVREEYKQFLTDYLAAIPTQITLEDLIAEGDKGVARYTLRGTHQGQWRGAPPTGKSVTFTGTMTFLFADGKVAEIWVNYDILSLVQQLGLVPAPGQAS
jgi:steroid delta-isomerase-like uncharacterized protein